jgi:predicted O-linked N-acetylglucosamine transferase (SPINDLY family)
MIFPINPTSKILLQLARDAICSSDHVSADEYYKKLITLESNNSYLQMEYASNLTLLGYAIEAKNIFKKYLSEDICAPSNYMLACDYLGVPISARKSIEQYYKTNNKSTAKHDYKKNKKINLCYITQDCNNHVNGRTIMRVIKNHNRDKFNIVLMYSGSNIDVATVSILPYVDRFIHIGDYPQENSMTSHAVYKLIQDLETDILIDCDGHSNGGKRLSIFAKKPAYKNISLFGYPNEMNLSFFEPKFINSYGYIPVFNTTKLSERIIKKNEDIIFGVISNPVKINKKDVEIYDYLLSIIPNSRLVYSRLKRQYTKQKANDIMSVHSETNRSRVSICNMMGKKYDEIYNTFDIILDTSNWNLHGTMIDSISCGVPVYLMPDISILYSSSLSRNVYKQIGIDIDCMPLSLSLMEYQLNNSKCQLNKFSDKLFNKMKVFDNTRQWVKEYEEYLNSLLFNQC